MFFEVAPDPNDAGLTARWNALDEADKFEISESVSAEGRKKRGRQGVGITKAKPGTLRADMEAFSAFPEKRTTTMPVKPWTGPHPFEKPVVIFGVKRPPSSADNSPEPKPPEAAPVDDTKAADPTSPGTKGTV